MSGDWSVSENDVGSTELTVLIEEYLRFKDPIEVGDVH